MTLPATALQLHSLISSSGELRVSLAQVPVVEPKDNEVVVRVEATPINPSDLGLLFGAADMSAASVAGEGDASVVTAPVPAGLMRAMAGRVDEAMPVGNEGAGVVVAAGASPEAQALLGKMVTMIGGAMYSQYRTLRVQECMLLPDGTTAEQGASDGACNGRSNAK
jgi:NADPH:quinone reductase